MVGLGFVWGVKWEAAASFLLFFLASFASMVSEVGVEFTTFCDRQGISRCAMNIYGFAGEFWGVRGLVSCVAVGGEGMAGR